LAAKEAEAESGDNGTEKAAAVDQRIGDCKIFAFLVSLDAIGFKQFHHISSLADPVYGCAIASEECSDDTYGQSPVSLEIGDVEEVVDGVADG
jgi:hypothetical protein